MPGQARQDAAGTLHPVPIRASRTTGLGQQRTVAAANCAKGSGVLRPPRSSDRIAPVAESAEGQWKTTQSFGGMTCWLWSRSPKGSTHESSSCIRPRGRPNRPQETAALAANSPRPAAVVLLRPAVSVYRRIPPFPTAEQDRFFRQFPRPRSSQAAPVQIPPSSSGAAGSTDSAAWGE